MLPEDEVALIVDVLDRAQLRTPAALSCLHVPDAEAFSSLLVKLGCEVPRFGGSTPNPGLQIIPDGLRLALKKFYMLLSPQFPELLQRETSAYWGTTGVRTSSEPVDSARVDGLLSSSEGRIMTGLPPIPNSRKKRAAQGSLKKLEDGKKAHFVKLLIDEYYIALDRYRGISIRPPPGRTLDEWLSIVLGKGAWRSIRDLVCGWRRFRRWADREKISAIPPNIETIIMFLDSIVRAGSATSSTPASVRTSIQGVVLRFGFPQVNWDDKEWQALVDAICEDDDAPLRQAPELPPALGPLLEKIAAGAAPTQNRPEGSPEVPGEFQQPTEFEQLMSFLSLVLMWSIARFDDGLHVAPPACTLDAQALFAVCWRTKVNRSRKAPRKLVVPRVAIVEPRLLLRGSPLLGEPVRRVELDTDRLRRLPPRGPVDHAPLGPQLCSFLLPRMVRGVHPILVPRGLPAHPALVQNLDPHSRPGPRPRPGAHQGPWSVEELRDGTALQSDATALLRQALPQRVHAASLSRSYALLGLTGGGSPSAPCRRSGA